MKPVKTQSGNMLKFLRLKTFKRWLTLGRASLKGYASNFGLPVYLIEDYPGKPKHRYAVPIRNHGAYCFAIDAADPEAKP